MHAVSPHDDQEGGAGHHHEPGHDSDGGQRWGYKDGNVFLFLHWHAIILIFQVYSLSLF